tara:strand:+ start:4691 stop:5092 length:402 start_codon:yes stop_codon:yes gene_type:complete
MSTAGTITFLEQLTSGKLATDKLKIYDFIKHNPNSDIDSLTFNLKLSKIVVGARLSELRKVGVIYITKTRIDSGKNLSKYMVQENDALIEYNVKDVRKEGFVKWLKKGTEYTEFLDPLTNEVIDYLLEIHNRH